MSSTNPDNDSSKKNPSQGTPKLSAPDLNALKAFRASSQFSSLFEQLPHFTPLQVDPFVYLTPEEALKKELGEAREMLSEAVKLDPLNTKASQALQQVRELINQLP